MRVVYGSVKPGELKTSILEDLAAEGLEMLSLSL